MGPQRGVDPEEGHAVPFFLKELEDNGEAEMSIIDLFAQAHAWWPAVVRWYGLEEDPIHTLTGLEVSAEVAQKWYALKKEEMLIRSNWDDGLPRRRRRRERFWCRS